MQLLGYTIARTNSAPPPDYSGMTLQEQFQVRYALNAINRLFFAFKYVGAMATIVTFVAMAINYNHQREFFASHHAGIYAWAIPISVDCVMLILIKISQMEAIRPRNRWIARGMLVLPAAGSMSINYLATDDDVMRWVYVGITGAIVVCEIAHGLMVPHLESMERKQAELVQSTKTAPPAPAKPAKTQTAIARNGERARELATANPAMTVTELVKSSGVGRDKARKILDEVNLLIIPVSPGVGPIGNYVGAKA